MTHKIGCAHLGYLYLGLKYLCSREMAPYRVKICLLDVADEGGCPLDCPFY
jgi:hypothetical protein